MRLKVSGKIGLTQRNNIAQNRLIASQIKICYSLSMKVRDVIKMLTKEGWFMVRSRGSHRQFKHSKRKGLVTISGKPNDDLAPGTLNSILKQAGLK